MPYDPITGQYLRNFTFVDAKQAGDFVMRADLDNALADISTALNTSFQQIDDVADQIPDQDFVQATQIGNGLVSTVVLPGVFPTKKNYIVRVNGVLQEDTAYTLTVGADTTTVTFSEPIPIGVLADVRVAKRVVITGVLEDEIEGLTTKSVPNRAAAVEWIAAHSNPPIGFVLRWPVGQIPSASADSVSVRFAGGVTILSDYEMPGFVPDGDVTPDHFASNTIPGTTDMADAMQSAANYAGTAFNPSLSYPGVIGAVYLRGRYFVGSGKTVVIPRGVLLKGESASSTWITHGGGGVNLIETDDSLSSNTHVVLEDFTFVGAGAGTLYGVYLHGDVRNGRMKGVIGRGCNRTVGGDTCFTLVVENCDFQDAIVNNVEFGNVTSALFLENRIDQAGECNVVITGSSAAPVVHVKFVGGHYQRAGQAAIRLIDVDSAEIIAPYFEGNNQDDASHGDIEWLHGASSRGRDLNVIGAFGTATTGGTNSRFIKASTAGRLTVLAPKTFIGTAPSAYAVGIDLGANMLDCTIVGGRINATTRVVRAGANTRLIDTEGSLIDIGSGTDFDISANNNLYLGLNSPANRRLELRLASAGVDKWFIGRGDSDETFPDDFYIARTSGGGATPDFRINDANGEVFILRLVLPGPFANDAAAATGGVQIGAAYRVTGGTVAWRVS